MRSPQPPAPATPGAGGASARERELAEGLLEADRALGASRSEISTLYDRLYEAVRTIAALQQQQQGGGSGGGDGAAAAAQTPQPTAGPSPRKLVPDAVLEQSMTHITAAREAIAGMRGGSAPAATDAATSDSALVNSLLGTIHSLIDNANTSAVASPPPSAVKGGQQQQRSGGSSGGGGGSGSGGSSVDVVPPAHALALELIAIRSGVGALVDALAAQKR